MRQLITTDSGKLSLTKFWSFIGCGVSTWIIIHLTLNNKLDWEYFVAYLGSVGGFSQISKWLAYRYSSTTTKIDTPPVEVANATGAVEIKKCDDCPSVTPGA